MLLGSLPNERSRKEKRKKQKEKIKDEDGLFSASPFNLFSFIQPAAKERSRKMSC
jgi:hypothetical protein